MLEVGVLETEIFETLGIEATQAEAAAPEVADPARAVHEVAALDPETPPEPAAIPDPDVTTDPVPAPIPRRPLIRRRPLIQTAPDPETARDPEAALAKGDRGCRAWQVLRRVAGGEAGAESGPARPTGWWLPRSRPRSTVARRLAVGATILWRFRVESGRARYTE